MSKVHADAVSAWDGLLKDGITIAAGGFGLCGIPENLIAAMVKKGVAAIKSSGADKVYAEIGDKANATWHQQDLYLVVYGLDGVVRAHGANAKMVGKNLIELKDIDGKAFVKERVDMAKTHGTFWQDYKFTNPETKKIEPKSMYCEKLDETVVCGGIYK
ncbi:MAG: cache domain-containing protein [Aquabacterium sp.]|nr:cache domain-containing protein [Aquabacterium sp.]